MKKLKSKAKTLGNRSKQLVRRKAGRTDAASFDNNLPPRITNETVAEHREEVLSSARKYIYPLQHSRHRIVIVSVSIFILAAVIFFAYTLLSLYRFHSTSTFIYRVTQVVPFPVAKAGPSFVSYENYLFEIRRYIHYYQTQQDVDFASKQGKEQLVDFEKRALDSVITDAYVKQLAKKHNVSVSRGEINDQIELLKSQNRLGGSQQVFEDVLREFWNWSPDDFRRELESQLLAQKVVSKLDRETHKHAEDRLMQLNTGGNFVAIAKQYSQDEQTRASGGDYGFVIERTSRDILPRVLDEMYKLQPGQVSNVIETPIGLEIIKVHENNAGKIRASHILFRFQPLSKYIDPLKKQNPPSRYVNL